MANSIIVLDKVKAVRAGHIYSVQSNDALQNGFVGVKGDLLTDEREIYNLVKPATANLKESLVVIASAEVNYEEYRKTDANLNKFAIPAQTPARAYELVKGDIISTDAVTLLATDAVKGNLVIAENGSYKLKEVAAATDVSGSGFVGKIIGVRTIGTTTAVGMAGAIGSVTKLVEIEVVKN